MYPHSTGWVIDRLYCAFGPSLSPAEYEEALLRDDIVIASHLVWKCRKVQTMDDSDKAGRWIGWIFAAMQFRLELMDNNQARDAARADAQLIKARRTRSEENPERGEPGRCASIGLTIFTEAKSITSSPVL